MFAWESSSIMQDRWCHLDSTKKAQNAFQLGQSIQNFFTAAINAQVRL
jgi:hypothetical protein